MMILYDKQNKARTATTASQPQSSAPRRSAPPLFLVTQCSSKGFNSFPYKCFSVYAALLPLSSIYITQSTSISHSPHHLPPLQHTRDKSTYLHRHDDIFPPLPITNFFISSPFTNNSIQPIQVYLLTRKEGLFAALAPSR